MGFGPAQGASGGGVTSAGMDTAFGSTQGDLLYRNASVWTVLAPGTNGQLLTSAGAGANPSWTTVSTSQTLAQTLVNGNTTGGKNIAVSSGDGLAFMGRTPVANSIVFGTGGGTSLKHIDGPTDVGFWINATNDLILEGIGNVKLSVGGGAGYQFLVAGGTGYVTHLPLQTTTASGTVVSFQTTGTFTDGGGSSSTVVQGLLVNPTINYTGSPKTGHYEALTINAVETSLPTGTNYLLRLQAGAAGGTDKLVVTNDGATTISAATAVTPLTVNSSGANPYCLFQSGGVNWAAIYMHAHSSGGTNPQTFEWYAISGESFGAGVGAGLAFNATNTAGGANSTVAIIKGVKENSNSGDTLGAITFYPCSATPTVDFTERARITSGGNLCLGSGGVFGFASTTASSSTLDTGLSRIGAKIVGIGSGVASDVSGTLRFATLQNATIDCSTATNAPIVKLNQASSTPANPAGTTNTTGVMAGLAVAFTPRSSGRVLVVVTCGVSNNTAADGINIQIRYGTGAAPANAAALTGTAIGAINQVGQVSNPGTVSSNASGIATGLTVGTAYWFDLSEAAVAGGTASVVNVTYNIIEL